MPQSEVMALILWRLILLLKEDAFWKDGDDPSSSPDSKKTELREEAKKVWETLQIFFYGQEGLLELRKTIAKGP